MVRTHFHDVFDDKVKQYLVKNTAGPPMNQFKSGNFCLSCRTYPNNPVELVKAHEDLDMFKTFTTTPNNL